MSVDRRLLNWGVFLVLLGGVPLAVTQGWIPEDIVGRAWELWPLVLIGAGIGLILSRTPFRAIGGIIVAGTFGVMLGALIAVGFAGFNIGNLGCGAADPGAPTILQEDGPLASSAASVRLQADCAAVSVGAQAGGTWAVDVKGTDSARPSVEETADGLVLRSPEGPVAFPFDTRRATWDLRVPTEPRLDLELALNAGSATVDLAGANVGRLRFDGNAIGDTRLDLTSAAVEQLDVEVNAASLAILLPAGADTTGSIQANAASVELCTAEGVGLRLLVEDNITASDNYDERGLVKVGGAWETPGYAGAATKVELRTSGSAVSFTLNPEDGCR